MVNRNRALLDNRLPVNDGGSPSAPITCTMQSTTSPSARRFCAYIVVFLVRRLSEPSTTLYARRRYVIPDAGVEPAILPSSRRWA